jgi:hypothetical protein
MGKHEKQKYCQMASADKKRYERELQIWQATHGKSAEDDEEDKDDEENNKSVK